MPSPDGKPVSFCGISIPWHQDGINGTTTKCCGGTNPDCKCNGKTKTSK